MSTHKGSASSLAGTPVDHGYHMPAEWEPHERTWMLWPARPDIWGNNVLPAQEAFAAIANAIGDFEPVTVGVPPDLVDSARNLLNPANVTIVVVEQDDAWMRDTGPIFLAKGRDVEKRHVRGVDWGFNAWGGALGGCYANWEKDETVACAVLAIAGVERYKVNMILEGGSIHVDGEGTLITTEECLLSQNRNPDLAKSDIETYLRTYLGVHSILWLGKGVCGDLDTDGHVDNLVAFARPGEVVLHWTDNVEDPQHATSLDAFRKLESFADARGRKLKVHKCNLPGPLYRSEGDTSSITKSPGTLERHTGERLAASYVNFYFANGVVILPGFGVPEDEAALRLFEDIFPERKVVQVNTRAIAFGGGNIHCVTQQQPAGITDITCNQKPSPADS